MPLQFASQPQQRRRLSRWGIVGSIFLGLLVVVLVVVGGLLTASWHNPVVLNTPQGWISLERITTVKNIGLVRVDDSGRWIFVRWRHRFPIPEAWGGGTFDLEATW